MPEELLSTWYCRLVLELKDRLIQARSYSEAAHVFAAKHGRGLPTHVGEWKVLGYCACGCGEVAFDDDGVAIDHQTFFVRGHFKIVPTPPARPTAEDLIIAAVREQEGTN